MSRPKLVAAVAVAAAVAALALLLPRSSSWIPDHDHPPASAPDAADDPAPPGAAAPLTPHPILDADRPAPPPAPVAAPASSAPSPVAANPSRSPVAPPPAAARPVAAPPPPAPPTDDEAVALAFRDGIRRAMRDALPEVRKCYEGALADHPDAGGKVVVEFELTRRDGKGHVDSGELSESALPGPLHDLCVMNALSHVELPAPPGAEGAHVTMRYPFVFSPTGTSRSP